MFIHSVMNEIFFFFLNFEIAVLNENVAEYSAAS